MTNIPTISELYTSVLNDLKSELRITSSLSGKVFLRALAAVQAAKLKLYYLMIARVQKNIFVDTADSESIGGTLERFGRVKLGRNPFPATAGFYTADVIGSIGATIGAGVTFKSDDTSLNPGYLYILDTAFTFTATSGQIQLRALTVGADAKLNVADTLTATAPMANVESQCTVAVEDTAPTASEDLEDYRNKVIESYQLEAQGGARSDYRIWASDANGVKNVYPYAKTGSAGEINLYIEAEAASSTDGKGTPPASMITEVEDVVNFDPDTTKTLYERGRRPLSAWEIYYLAITPLDIDISIASLSDSSATEKTAITNAVEAFLSDIRPYISGADDPNNISDTLFISQLISVINGAISAGNNFTNVTFEVDGAASTSWQFTDGDIPYLNNITYI